MDHAFDEAIAVVALLISLGLLMAGAMLLLLIWFCIAAVVVYIRYEHYRREAEARFDQIAAQHGLDFDVDEAIQMAYGVGIDLPDDGYESIGEWVSGSLFGVVDEERIA